MIARTKCYGTQDPNVSFRGFGLFLGVSRNEGLNSIFMNEYLARSRLVKGNYRWGV